MDKFDTRDERIVETVRAGNMQVAVVQIDGVPGYRFDAIGEESLPLAIALAHRQAQEWRR